MATQRSRMWTSFVRDRRGNVAIIFALSAIPTIALIGFAIDYGTATAGKAKLDAAADAASMAAITTAQTVIQGSGTTAAAISQGQAAAAGAFKANAGTIGFTTIPTPTINLARDTLNPQKITATVSYQTTTQTILSNVIGLQKVNLYGTSTSTLTMPTYINYYIIVDSSQSMGIGSTATDMQNLYNRVIQYSNYDTQSDANAKIGCVFGCHVPQTPGGGYTQPDSTENLAHLSKYGAKITLRIDAAASAIQDILTDATNAYNQSQQNLIKIGVYTMQQDPTVSGSYIQNIVSPPNYNFTATSAAVTSKLDLGNNTGAGIGDTSFANSLNYFTSNILTTQGDGSTAASALNYVFLITDGISDVPGSCTDGHCTAAFDDSLCTQLKTKATVGVIYTTYNPIYNNNNSANGYVQTYSDLVANNVGNVPINLKACSSGSQYYYEATDGPAISTGMQQLFLFTAQAARISQ